MKSIKLSEFLNNEISPFLLGAFLSRIMNEKIANKNYFYAYTSFKESKIIPAESYNFEAFANEFNKVLNFHSKSDNWIIHEVNNKSIQERFYLENDLSWSRDEFYKALYIKLMSSPWVIGGNLNENKKSFIRGFSELRGSVDTSRTLLSQDYFYNNKVELKKAEILTDTMDLPIQYANINPRDLQPQFVSGECRRNTQFRINIKFYANRIGFINKYKAEIFGNTYPHSGMFYRDNVYYFDCHIPRSRDDNTTFIRYLNFFTNNIYQQELTDDVIQELRRRLGFDYRDTREHRSRTLIELFRDIAPDVCAICGRHETYTEANTGRQHFEIHHVIPFAHGYGSTDNLANLVKLCPTCHEMFGRASASRNDIINAVTKILTEHEEIYEFACGYLGIDNIKEQADKIFEIFKEINH